MIKRKISMITAAVMMIALLMPAFAFGEENDYSAHWAADTIQEWFDNGMVKGYEDGSFKPDNSISRAEFMTMVNNSYDLDEKAEISFDDTDEDEWYYPEVQKAVKEGYIVGNGDNTIRPLDAITREEVAVIISRLNDLDENSDIVYLFEDSDEISHWAVGFVGAVFDAEYMIGNDKDEFCPRNNITRAEALVTMDRAMEDIIVNYASINDITIEGVDLEQEFNAERTTYSAIASTQDFVEIKATATTNSAIEITSNATDSEIAVTTSSAVNGNVAYLADIPLKATEDTIVTFTVSSPGLEDRLYTITIKKD